MAINQSRAVERKHDIRLDYIESDETGGSERLQMSTFKPSESHESGGRIAQACSKYVIGETSVVRAIESPQ